MKPAHPAPKTIDDYIAAFPPEVQAILEQIRMTIRATAPDARETISYGMPTFTLNGHYLVYFAAYKKHIGLYPAPIGVEEFQEAVSVYGSGKGTMQFPLDQPMPLDMLTLAATEGIAGGIQAEVADVIAPTSNLQDVALNILVQTATDPSILGMASHVLYIGQR